METADDGQKLDYLSEIYSMYRQDTPEIIISKILSYLTEEYKGSLDIAVDVGCGSGQGTVALAPFFKKVYGIDSLENQIQEAKSSRQLDNIEYIAGPSEKLPFDDGSIQLITAATSIHWFDLDVFYPEVKRVLCSNGILAAYVYVALKPVFKCHKRMEEMDRIYDEYYKAIDPYVLPRAKIALQNYKTLDFPFEAVIKEHGVRCPFEGKLSNIIGYLQTHSHYKSCKEKEPGKADKIIKTFQERLYKLGAEENISPDGSITLFRDYTIVVGRKVN